VTRGLLALCCLLLLPACAAQTAAERRDEALNAALEAGRLACLTILANPDIPREPGVNEWCEGVVRGCPR
jgi:hypothetical protein